MQKQKSINLSTICVACGADAVIYAEDGNSCKCDECGQFSSRN